MKRKESGVVIVFAVRYDPATAADVRRRLRRVRAELRELIGFRGADVDGSHLADLAGALEGVASILRRARASTPRRDDDEPEHG